MPELKIVVLNRQEENWKDDGGNHDLTIYEVTEEQFNALESLWLQQQKSQLPSDEDLDAVLDKAVLIENPTYPLLVHKTYSFWYKY